MTIRNIDDGLKLKLRVRAAQHGRSMEEEARDILRTALTATESPSDNLAASIRRKVDKVGGVDFELPPRTAAGEPVDFGE